MPLEYKIDILSALKKAGYNTTRLRKEKILSESTIQKFRRGQMISSENLATLCELLHLQPGDLIIFKSDKEQQADHREQDRAKIIEYANCDTSVTMIIKNSEKHPFLPENLHRD